MTIIDMPASIWPFEDGEAFCDVVPFVARNTAVGRRVPMRAYRGERWEQTITLRTFGEAEAALDRVITQLLGGVLTLRAPDYGAASVERFSGQAPLFADGSYFADGSGFTASAAPVVTVTGAHSAGETTVAATADGLQGRVLNSGHRISIGGVLYKLISPFDASDTGLGALDLWPALRLDVADGASVVTSGAAGLWAMEEWPRWRRIEETDVFERTLTLVEDLREIYRETIS